jgi:hypothetical protein
MSEHTTQKELAQQRDWDNPDLFWVPEKWLNRIRLQGLIHRWLRVTEEGGRIDRRLSLRLQEGWKLVKPEECPEWEQPPTGNYGGNYNGIIAVGDAALAVCSREKAFMRKAATERRAVAMESAVREGLKELNTRKMPVFDESKSSTSIGGRKVEFAK